MQWAGRAAGTILLILLGLAPWGSLAPEVWLGAGDRFLGEQAFARAEEAFLRARSAGAAGPDLRLRIGFLALACGEGDQAERAFREAARGRTLARAWAALGDLSARRGDLTAAVSWWRLALLASEEAGLRERIGWAELRRGHFWEARWALEAAWAAGQRTCPTAFGLAALAAHDNPSEALRWLREPCQEAPWADLWTWWPALAPDALDVEGLAEALSQAAEEDDPVQRAARLGQGFTALGLPSLAEREWLTVLSERPDWGTAWAYLGHARARLGKPALEDLERAVALEPQSEEAWYFLGRWWAGNGVPQIAAEAFRKGLKAHPESVALTLELAYALAAARDYAGAEALFARAEGTRPPAEAFERAHGRGRARTAGRRTLPGGGPLLPGAPGAGARAGSAGRGARRGTRPLAPRGPRTPGMGGLAYRGRRPRRDGTDLGPGDGPLPCFRLVPPGSHVGCPRTRHGCPGGVHAGRGPGPFGVLRCPGGQGAEGDAGVFRAPCGPLTLPPRMDRRRGRSVPPLWG